MAFSDANKSKNVGNKSFTIDHILQEGPPSITSSSAVDQRHKSSADWPSSPMATPQWLISNYQHHYATSFLPHSDPWLLHYYQQQQTAWNPHIFQPLPWRGELHHPQHPHGPGLYLATGAAGPAAAAAAAVAAAAAAASMRLSRRHPRKGGQIRFTHQQSSQLEETFASQRYLTPAQRRSLANRLALTERQVKTWFQNRRAKWRRTSKDKLEPTAEEEDTESEEDEEKTDCCSPNPV